VQRGVGRGGARRARGVGVLHGEAVLRGDLDVERVGGAVGRGGRALVLRAYRGGRRLVALGPVERRAELLFDLPTVLVDEVGGLLLEVALVGVLAACSEEQQQTCSPGDQRLLHSASSLRSGQQVIWPDQVL